MTFRIIEMSKLEFLKLMNFPTEWMEWGLYPDELFNGQLQLYKKGDELAAEHDRNGAFHWWLRQNPSIDILKQLLELTYKDEDELMASDARQHILKAIDEASQ